jgi:serine phosphatase RsbU (regulator of sigma subunit)
LLKCPATAVAGDFYEFLPLDENRIGVLLADVTGHGVPAALIAAMIKVAMQSVIDCAADPGEVLRRLNRILSPQLSGRLVPAAYLLLDSENRTALYAGADHPPLVHLHLAFSPYPSNSNLSNLTYHIYVYGGSTWRSRYSA